MSNTSTSLSIQSPGLPLLCLYPSSSSTRASHILQLHAHTAVRVARGSLRPRGRVLVPLHVPARDPVLGEPLVSLVPAVEEEEDDGDEGDADDGADHNARYGAARKAAA